LNNNFRVSLSNTSNNSASTVAFTSVTLNTEPVSSALISTIFVVSILEINHLTDASLVKLPVVPAVLTSNIPVNLANEFSFIAAIILYILVLK